MQHSGYGFTDPTIDPTVLNAWDDTPATLDNDYFLKLTDIVIPNLLLIPFLR